MPSEIKKISVARWFDPLIASCTIAATYLLFDETSISNTHLVLLIVLLTTIYYFTSELLRVPWKIADRPKQSGGEVMKRTLTKFFGVLCGIALIYAALRIIPEYAKVDAISLVHGSIVPFLTFVIPASCIFIYLAEYLLGERKDGTYQFGLLLEGRIKDVDWNVFLDGVLEWLVRCIFVLINFVSASSLLARLRSNGLPDVNDEFVRFILELNAVIFTIIIFAILPGYLFASRIIRTQVKKVDRSWFGWMITLSCYSPLNSVVFTSWVSYAPAFASASGIWAAFSESYPPLLYFLGASIILFGLIHLWGEATMGIRSSNLSCRGVITTGPFRFTKHPVYVSKCFQWAVLYLPILNGVGILGAISSGILFFLV